MTLPIDLENYRQWVISSANHFEHQSNLGRVFFAVFDVNRKYYLTGKLSLELNIREDRQAKMR